MSELWRPHVLVVQARLDDGALQEEQALLDGIAAQTRRGADLTYANALDKHFDAQGVTDRLDSFDGYVLLGSSNVSLTDEGELKERYRTNVDPIVDHALVEGTRDTHPKPSLGICLGAQEFHVVAGATIETDPAQAEAGTTRIRLQPHAQQDPLFAGIPRKNFKMIFAHNDVAGLGEGFVALGSTDRHKNSITRRGEVVTVQGHPEDTDTTRLDRVVEKGIYTRTYPSAPAPFAPVLIQNVIRRTGALAQVRRLAA